MNRKIVLNLLGSVLVIGFFVVLGFVLSGWFGTMSTAREGTPVSQQQSSEQNLNVPLFSQRDSRWADEGLGTCTPSQSTIGDYGCFVTSKAMVFNYYQPSYTDPLALDNCLADDCGPDNCGYAWNDVVDCYNLMKWDNFCTPSQVYWADDADGYDTEAIDNELIHGYPVLAWVSSSQASSHMVVITGKSDSTYLINDPWDDSRQYTLNDGALGSYTVIKLQFYHGPVSPPPPPSCPPENCTPGNEVGRGFFVQVVERLTDVPVSDFAVDALVLWEPHENTLACWNPLATTRRMEFVCDFNSVGVQHYQSQDMGTQATADTLALGYYDNIRRMLRLEEFNREGLRADLDVWGTCSGQTCNSLLDEWEALWNDQEPPPSPADLKQASDLEFSPPDPSVGDTVHFWFKVRNDGGEAIEVTEIGPFGYGPNHTPWDANHHGNVEIAANGGEETIHGYRTFEEDEAGVWTVDGIHYQLVSDPEPRSYYDLPANGHRAAGMDVVVRGPSDLRQCLDLEIHPDPPIMLGEEVRFCTDFCNYGDQPSVFKYFGPEGRDPDDRNWDAFIEDNFSIPPDSYPYTFDMYARFYKPGEWWVDQLAVQINDDWLTRYTLPSDGHLQSFYFDVVCDPDHLITFVEVIGSDREYRVVENLGVDDKYYTDRDYTILSLPKGFENLSWIMSSNEDDQQTREEFLYFALNNDADICIAYDQRVNPLPNWMDDFEGTGLFLEVSDSMASPLEIYCRHYPLGKVILGGNLASGAGHSGSVSNYVVLAKTPCILFGDFDPNGRVDVADIMLVAAKWRTTDDGPDWDPRYDLNGDGIITVVDIMLVVAHWGETCE